MVLTSNRYRLEPGARSCQVGVVDALRNGVKHGDDDDLARGRVETPALAAACPEDRRSERRLHRVDVHIGVLGTAYDDSVIAVIAVGGRGVNQLGAAWRVLAATGRGLARISKTRPVVLMLLPFVEVGLSR